MCASKIEFLIVAYEASSSKVDYLILIEIMIGSISYEDHSKEEKLLVLN